MWLSPEQIAARSERLVELAAVHGRPCPTTALLILTRIDDDAAHARAQAEAHIAGQYRMALDAVERWTLLDSIDGAVQRLAEYAEVGVQEFLLLALGDDPLTQYERLAAVSARLTGANPQPRRPMTVDTPYRYDASPSAPSSSATSPISRASSATATATAIGPPCTIPPPGAAGPTPSCGPTAVAWPTRSAPTTWSPATRSCSRCSTGPSSC